MIRLKELNGKPMFSIIVPAYNNGKYISKCIDSVLQQTFSDLELIVVNDGSTDDTLEIIKKFEEQDLRLKVIDKKNGGVSSARNVGLDNINGQYVLFLDSDDWYELNYCEELADLLKKNNADIVFSTKFYIEESKIFEAGKNAVNYPKSVIDLLSKFTYSLTMTCIKSDLLTKDLRFDENLHYYEDGEFLTRLLVLKPHIVYNEHPSFHFRPGSITHSKFTRKTLTQIDTNNIIDNRFKGINRKLDSVLKQRYVSMIAGMSTIAAKDLNHDKSLDRELQLFAKKNLKKILFSKSKLTFKVKAILVAVSPQTAYRIIRMVLRN